MEAVEPLLQQQLAQPGKWRALQVREPLCPPARTIVALAGLTPSLDAYDQLLESEVACG